MQRETFQRHLDADSSGCGPLEKGSGRLRRDLGQQAWTWRGFFTKVHAGLAQALVAGQGQSLLTIVLGFDGRCLGFLGTPHIRGVGALLA